MKSIWLLLVLSLAIIVFVSCNEEKDNPTEPSDQPPHYQDGEGSISEQGGIVEDTNPDSPTFGTIISIPEGALSGEQNISIQAAPDTLSLPGDEESIVVDLQPAGLTFDEPVVIGLPYDPDVQDEDNITAFYYNPDSSLVSELPVDSVDTQNHIVYATIQHFSYYTAADGVVRLDMEMFRDSQNKICCRVRVYGIYNNQDYGLAGIPTKLGYALDGYGTARKVIDDYIPAPPDLIQSYFVVGLKKYNQFWFDEQVDGQKLRVEHQGASAAVMLGEDPEDMLYWTGPIYTDDEMASWFDGDCLVFRFDETPNPNSEYYVGVAWALARDPQGLIWRAFTGEYEFNNVEARQSLYDLPVREYDSDPMDHVVDSYQDEDADNTPPEIEFVSPPTPEDESTVSGTIEVLAEATDNVEVQNVVFEIFSMTETVVVFEDASPQNGDQYSPPPWSTIGYANDEYTIRATARDMDGNTNVVERSIFVDNSGADTEPPEITYVSPLPGETVSGMVELVAQATDNVGVERVVFEVYEGNQFVEIGEDTTPDPNDHYSVTWNTYSFSDGQHNIHATAYDAAGNEQMAGWAVSVDNGGGGNIIEQDFELGNTGEYVTMIWIDPGTYWMGAQDGEDDAQTDEYPRHEVTISQGFWMGKYEVTQEQWEAVMGDWDFYFDGNPTHPAEQVSHNDISNDFLPSINAAEPGDPWRLPTEAEWEYACRAGYDETRFWYSDDPGYTELEDYAWFSWNNDPNGTKPVGQKIPNPWGLYDMHGNVWEWCLDWYDSHYYDDCYPAVTDPQGPEGPLSHRVLRGGSWSNDPQRCRSANRGTSTPPDRRINNGFRLVRISPSP
ncbi:SUMF1/EgtB/PvdO family nonheme iron enzyme [bacterium]|nr:SUMF1/EgtB/PvdO family nonheme iron enzyme [bacterium]